MKNFELEHNEQGEWFFIESKALKHCMDDLIAAEELMYVEQFEQGKTILTEIIANVPECIEAYNDLYICYLHLDEEEKAFNFLQNSVQNILDHLPKSLLSKKKQKLYWGFLENRPFLRVYANLANEYLDRRQFKTAQNMYEKLLEWNPNDNQGARESLSLVYFELKELEKALALCKAYKDDCIPAVTYAKPLAHFLRQEIPQAKKALQKAIKRSPNVAKELVKSRHTQPKTAHPGYITLGGEDEAYEYWQTFGKFWKNLPDAKEAIKEMLDSQPKTKS